jgi:GNAT superfamily N-acetyltransferase
VRVEVSSPAAEPGSTLIRELWADLAIRYADDPTAPEPTGESDDLELHELEAPTGTFVIAYDDSGVAVGCGGIRRHDQTTGEIKRMWVPPEHRRRGISRALLRALEDGARALGYDRLVLETGVRQPEALALYESAGYEIIPNYGFFADSPLSRCYAKDL